MMAPDDFYRAMCALGFFPPQEEAEAMFLELDTDGNGKLDFDEFSQFMSGCVVTFHSLRIPLSSLRQRPLAKTLGSRCSAEGSAVPGATAPWMYQCL